MYLIVLTLYPCFSRLGYTMKLLIVKSSYLFISLMRLMVFLQGTNAVFQYQKAASASGVPFNINPSSGTITVSGSLDYETTPFYSFTVS